MKYSTQINESVDFLLEAEKKRGNALDRDRARFLRLLKTGECKSQASSRVDSWSVWAPLAAAVADLPSQGIWKGLMQTSSRRGFGKLTSQQIGHLRQFLSTDQAQTLEHIKT